MPALLLVLLLASGTGCTAMLPLGVYVDSRMDRAKLITVEEAAAIEPGHTLRVALQDSTEAHGPLVRVEQDAEPPSLVLRVQAEDVPVPFANITAVERYGPPPNLWSAVLVGAAVDIVLVAFVVDRSLIGDGRNLGF